jgi:hypothetical protein
MDRRYFVLFGTAGVCIIDEIPRRTVWNFDIIPGICIDCGWKLCLRYR